jgi:hypothetical protein
LSLLGASNAPGGRGGGKYLIDQSINKTVIRKTMKNISTKAYH